MALIRNRSGSTQVAALGAALLLVIVCPAVLLAGVTVYLLDSSGSMRSHGFEEAKDVLIQEVEAARAGDVIYVGSFDVSERLLGRVAVGEDDSPEAKAELVSKIRHLRANGKWTNLDLPVKAGKALLLEERVPGTRKIVILSDGLSDPAPGFEKVDLQKMAEMIPHRLGFSIYMLGLPADVAGFFGTSPEVSEVVSAPQAPHIKGIPLTDFTRERIEKGVKIVREDNPAPPSNSPSPPKEPGKKSPAPFPIVYFLAGSMLLLVIGGATWRIGRRNRMGFYEISLEVQEGKEESKRFDLMFSSGMKKSVGRNGDVPLQDDALPPVAFTLLYENERIWLIPQDSVALNTKAVTAKAAVAPGDLITVRGSTRIAINEREEKGDES